MRPDTMRVDSAHSDFIAAGNFMSTGFFARAHRVRGGFFALVGLLLFAFALPASAQTAPSFPVDKFEYIFINTSERGPIGIVGTNSEQIANTLTYTFSPALRVGYELSKSTSRGAYINATGSSNHGWVTYTLTAENSAGSDTAQVIFKNVSQPSFGSQWSNYVFTFYQSPPTTFRMPEINVSAYDLQFSRYRFGGSQTSLSDCGLLDVPATGSEYIRDYILRSDSTTKLSGDPAVDSAKCDYGSHSFFGHYNVDGGFQSARLANLQFVVLASAPGPSLGQGNVGFTSGAASLKTLNAAGVPGGIGASITTYTIAPETGTMPDSLTFNPDTRQLGSTDAIVAGDAGSYVYTATDSRNLSVAVTFSVTVAAAVSLDPANPADLAFEAGTAAVITLPTPAGGVPTSGQYNHTLYVDDTLTGQYTYPIPGMQYRIRHQNITQIFGTPTTVGEHEIRFSATDTNGSTANATFSVSITSLPVFTQQADLSFTAGFARTFNLDAATGGTGTLQYALSRIVSGATETIPNSLVFTAADNRELRSTNALAKTDGGSYEFKVTDDNDMVTTTFSIIVADQLVAGANPGNQLITMVAGTAITAIDIADATGGQDTNYALTGGGSTLADGDEIGIAGLTYNARISGSPATPANISGEPTATGSVMLTYTATDANGATVSVAFSVEVIDLPTFPTAQGNVEFTAGFVKTVELNQASGGLSPLTYSLKRIASGGALETIPDTLVFVAADRELSSTAGLVTMSAGSYEYRVTDARGNFATSIFMVNIAPQLVAGANPGDQTILSTDTAAITLADATGGKATVGYTLNTAGSALTNGANIGIAGLIYNSRSSGTEATITGMPTATGQVMLTYTATDANGASVSYDFAVNAFDMPTFLTAQPNLSFTVGHPVTTFLNQALGGNPANSVTYSLMRIVNNATQAIPNGLTFNTATRELGNTDNLTTFDVGSYELKVTATNGMTAGTFSIAVAPALVAAANPGAQTFLVGDAKSVTLGNASGGQAGLVYALTVGGVPVADGGQVSAAGIAYTAATSTNPATISGTAMASGATTQVVYTVTDANGATAAFTFALNVFPKPSFAATQPDLDFTAGFARTFTLGAATGGTSPLNYGLSRIVSAAPVTIPDELVFTATSSGIELRSTDGLATTAAGSYELTVTDGNGIKAMAGFTIAVAGQLAFPDGAQPADLTLLTGTTIAEAINFGSATGGKATVNHVLTRGGSTIAGGTAAFPGVTYTAATGSTPALLSGTPTEDNVQHMLTYTATDANGASVSFVVNAFIAASPVFDPLAIAATYTQNYAIYSSDGTRSASGASLTLPAAFGGVAPLSYAVLVNNLQTAGLTPTVQTDNRVFVSGTPSAIGDFTYTRQVVDANADTEHGTFSLTVNVAAAPVFTTTQAQVHFTEDDARVAPETAQLIAVSGGAGDVVYTLNRVSPDGTTVPAALSIDSATQILSASTAIKALDTGRYEIIATDINGITATSGQFEITVTGPLALPDSIDDITFTLGLSQSRVLQAAVGGFGTLSYDIDAQSGSVYPTELFSLNFNSRELAYLGGGQTYVAGGTASFALTWKVIDETTPTAMTMSASFNIIVVDSPTFAQDDIDELIGGYSFHVGTALPAAATLPAVTDGALPLTYKLTDGANSPYGQAAFGKNGITFDASTRVFSGTPEREIRHRMHYHVRDANGSMVAQNTSVRIIAAMTLTQSDLLFGNGQGGIDMRLAEPVNNIDPANFNLTNLDGTTLSTLPNGINYDAATNRLSGTAPATESTTSFAYTATDPFDNSTAVTTFAIQVVLRPTFDAGAPTQITYTVGASGAQADGVGYETFTLSEATGGNGIITYETRANLPSGLTADEQGDGSVVFSGAPTRTGEYVYTRSAFDTMDETSTFTLTIVVVAAPRFTDSIPAMVFTPGQAGVNFTLPVASGGVVGDGGYTYSVAGLPTGLSLDDTVPSIGGIPTTFTPRANYTFEATDANGATAQLLFALTVTDELAFTEEVESVYTFTVGGAVQLPSAGGGQGPYTYSQSFVAADGSFTAALAFDANTRRISGALTISSGANDLANNGVIYSVTDSKGVVESATFNLHIVPIVFSAGGGDLRFRVNQAVQYDLTSRLLVTRAVGVEVTGYSLVPLGAADAVAEGLTYSTNAAGFEPKLTGDGTFGAGDEPIPTELTLTATYSVGTTDPITTFVTQSFKVRVADGTELVPVNEKMLSKVAAASVAGTLGAITDRIATATSAVPIVSIGGQSPMMALAQTIKAWADDAVDTTALIANSKFVLPFNRGGYGADSTASGAVWGSAHFRQLKGDDEDADLEGGLPTVEWSGNISGVHLGFDFKVSDDTLLGLAVSRSRASMDYKTNAMDNTGTLVSEEGEYEIDLNAVHPYINWAVGDVNLYASAGVGEGELTVTPDDESLTPALKSDLKLTAYGLGVSGDLNESVQVRGEWRRGEIKVDGNIDDENTIAPQNLNTSTTRILARWHDANRRDDNRAIFAEVGWRLDGGDGDSGAGMETALGWNYLGDRTTVEIGAHGLIGRDDYSEWGAYGNFRVSSGNDGQGFAVRIRPSYGESQTEFGRVWNADSLDDIDAGDDNDAADKNYAWRTESRLSYGIQSANGLFAPFIDAVAGDAADDIYRLGVDWSPHPYFDLNLTGERRHNQDDDENRILLQGEVKF